MIATEKELKEVIKEVTKAALEAARSKEDAPKITREDILAIPDMHERQQAIREHMDLFKGE